MVLVATVLTLTGCASNGHYEAGHPELFVAPSAPCPRNLGAAQDVRNVAAGLRSGLVPPGRPRAALVCVYRSSVFSNAGASTLGRTVRLRPRDALRLTRDLPLVSLKPPHGKFNCGAGPSGSVTVIAFDYAHRPVVDLWFSTIGCQTLDNGYVMAEAAGNSSFYEYFVRQFDALVP
jgi:hypothetical protein